MTTREEEGISTSEMLSFRLFPLGRQGFALRTLDEALVGIEDPFLRQKIADAIDFGGRARDLELDWRGHQRVKEYGAEAQRIDYELDRAVGALHAVLTATVDLHGASSTRGVHARLMIDRLFPKGVRHVIHLAFHEEEHMVNAMLERTRSEPELVEAVRELELGPVIERVTELHARYRLALPRKPSKAVTYEQVQAARREGHELLCEVVVLVRGVLLRGGLEEHQVAQLDAALREVLRQNEAIKRPYRRRGLETDVDPETGADVEEEGEDGEVEGDSDSTGLDEVDAA